MIFWEEQPNVVVFLTKLGILTNWKFDKVALFYMEFNLNYVSKTEDAFNSFRIADVDFS